MYNQWKFRLNPVYIDIDYMFDVYSFPFPFNAYRVSSKGIHLKLDICESITLYEHFYIRLLYADDFNRIKNDLRRLSKGLPEFNRIFKAKLKGGRLIRYGEWMYVRKSCIKKEEIFNDSYEFSSEVKYHLVPLVLETLKQLGNLELFAEPLD